MDDNNIPLATCIAVPISCFHRYVEDGTAKGVTQQLSQPLRALENLTGGKSSSGMPFQCHSIDSILPMLSRPTFTSECISCATKKRHYVASHQLMMMDGSRVPPIIVAKQTRTSMCTSHKVLMTAIATETLHRNPSHCPAPSPISRLSHHFLEIEEVVAVVQVHDELGWVLPGAHARRRELLPAAEQLRYPESLCHLKPPAKTRKRIL